MEKWLYLLMIVFFLYKMDPTQCQGPPGHIYYCAYSPKLFLKPEKESCKNYMCWDSQLTDTNRITLTSVFNDYKATVASGICVNCKGRKFSPVFKMTYSWYLEFTAKTLIQRIHCSSPLVDKLSDESIPLVPSNPKYMGSIIQRGALEYHYGISSFVLTNTDFRDDAISHLKDIFNDESKSRLFFSSWIQNDTLYVYGASSFFGCAIILQNNHTGKTTLQESTNNNRVAFMLCVFSSKSNNSNAIAEDPSIERCYTQDRNAKFDRKNNLCYYEPDPEISKFDSTCQIYYSNAELDIPKELCKDSVPPTWQHNIAPRNTDEIIEIRGIFPTRSVIQITNLNLDTITINTTNPTEGSPINIVHQNSNDHECSSFQSCGITNTIIFVVACLISVVILVYLLKQSLF